MGQDNNLLGVNFKNAQSIEKDNQYVIGLSPMTYLNRILPMASEINDAPIFFLFLFVLNIIPLKYLLEFLVHSRRT